MSKNADYHLIKQFINTFKQQGFENIDRQDALVLELEAHLKRDKQFFYVANLLPMKICYVSQNVGGVLGDDNRTFDLSSILSRVHPEDYHKHSLARSLVIKKGYDLLMHKGGISLQSICSRIRGASGKYFDSTVQAYSFFDSKHATVFVLILLTEMSVMDTIAYRHHYYVGDDPTMFRYPDEALLDIGHNFSDREFEIVQLIATGQSSEQMADQLHLSLNTINTHRRNILKKTKKSTLRELIDELREKGML